ncbi:MAG TPA: CofH family radical SAM protein [Candidatus Eisenbacteria bacterium]|jgi:aminodeoxyfutalosine synthase|nr:CofH family radical SAM protein [Candidatus Eisenbacteria bacterium]
MNFIREFKDIFEKVKAGTRLSREDGERLIRSKNLIELGAMADYVRRRMHGQKAHFTHSINVNHTNVCVLTCKFCAWAKGKRDHDGYVLAADEVERRVREAAGHGVWEVHIVGGLHADLRMDYYEEMLRRIKKACPGVLIQGFTAVELDFYARLEKITVEEVIDRLIAAGLGGVPGGGAEIFAERPRKLICESKIDADRWLAVHRAVHRAGLRSNATMLYGHLETPEERVDHLIRLREAQDETGGYLAFVPLAFQPENNDLSYLPRTSGVTDLQVLATSRLMLDNFPHIRQLWNYVDEKLIHAALDFGVDDLGGTNYDETIAKAAGSQEKGFTYDELVAMIRACGREPVEVNSTYTPIRKELLVAS